MFMKLVNLPKRYNNCKHLCSKHSWDLKGKTESSTIIVRDFTTPLLIMDRIIRQKINKEQKTSTL